MKKKKNFIDKKYKDCRTIMEKLTGVWWAKKMCRITL